MVKIGDTGQEEGPCIDANIYILEKPDERMLLKPRLSEYSKDIHTKYYNAVSHIQVKQVKMIVHIVYLC